MQAVKNSMISSKPPNSFFIQSLTYLTALWIRKRMKMKCISQQEKRLRDEACHAMELSTILHCIYFLRIRIQKWRDITGNRGRLPLFASTAQKTMTQILQDFNKNLFLRSLKFPGVLNIIDEYKNLTVKINKRWVDKNAFENLQCNGISLVHTQKNMCWAYSLWNFQTFSILVWN